jgi:signal transduction histidine kinase
VSRVTRFLSSRRGADLLLWLAVCGPVFLLAEPPYQPRLPLPWVQIAAVPLLALAVAVGRRHPVAAAAVPPALGLAASAELYAESFMIAQILLAFLLGRRTAGFRTGLLFCAAVCLTGPALAGLATGDPWNNRLNVLILGNVLLTILLPWLAGRYARQHDQLMRTGWELAERLEREQLLIGERIRLLERSRIAGDMHDSLGHELSLIAVRAAALQVRPGLDDAARSDAGELRRSAADATERLREIIGVLRREGEPAPVLPAGETVPALVERAAASGMAVTLEGELPPLPPMTERAAHRVVQEALTNAAKHAPGAAVTVRLGADPAAGEAAVSVTNAAPAGPPPGTASGGYGFVSLDERVRLTGGRMHARAVDGGFTVAAYLPLTAGASAAPRGTRPAPVAARRLAAARRDVRRSIIDAVWLPVTVAAVLLVLGYAVDLDDGGPPRPGAEVYEALRIGQAQSSVESRLGAHRDGDARPEAAPADPPGTDECRFYRVRNGSPSPAYRLCFTDGQLSHRDRMTRTQP